jgi:hypothetical protein
MSKQNPGILFIGSTEKAHALAKQTEARGWLVYHTAQTMEALALYLFCYPDLVVIDQADYPITAAEVSFHLHSLNDAAPIFVVTNPELPVLISQIEVTIYDIPVTL